MQGASSRSLSCTGHAACQHIPPTKPHNHTTTPSPTLRLGVSGMASSGCCAVCTTAWYSAAPGRSVYATGSLTASWLQASPISSACRHAGRRAGRQAAMRMREIVVSKQRGAHGAIQLAEACQQRHKHTHSCRHTNTQRQAGRAQLAAHQLRGGVVVVRLQEEAGHGVPGGGGNLQHALPRRPEAACRWAGGRWRAGQAEQGRGEASEVGALGQPRWWAGARHQE